jgi:hypothetical protein
MKDYRITLPTSITDISPTALWSLGIPPPLQFRGRIIWEIFKENTTIEREDSAHQKEAYRWFFNRSLATENFSLSATEEASEVREACQAPKRAPDKVNDLGWSIFGKIVTPFVFLVVGYALGLGVRFTTLSRVWETGTLEDEIIIEGLTPRDEGSREPSGEELGIL